MMGKTYSVAKAAFTCAMDGGKVLVVVGNQWSARNFWDVIILLCDQYEVPPRDVSPFIRIKWKTQKEQCS